MPGVVWLPVLEVPVIAGRCLCGIAFSLFGKRDWDLHMRCFGVRWCGVCGEVALFGGRCSWRWNHPTTRARWRSEGWRAYQRRHRREQRRKGSAAYVREKERKRERYRSDPEFAARVKAAAVASYQRQKAHKRKKYAQRRQVAA